MTTPPLHNTDEPRVDEVLDYLDTGDTTFPGRRPTAKSAILSLLAEARKTERQSFESIAFDACDAANLSGPNKRDVMKFVTEALLPKESK